MSAEKKSIKETFQFEMEARFGGIRFEGARLIFARSPAHPCANDPAENGPLLRKIGIGRTPVASNV